MINKRAEARRDIRLVIAMLLFIASVIAGLVQAWILQLYLDAAISGHWAYFSKIFSVQQPASGPNGFCLDHCVADLPFLPGWIGIVSFLLGLTVLIYSWWKPRTHAAPTQSATMPPEQ
jgi:hypothetical protein